MKKKIKILPHRLSFSALEYLSMGRSPSAKEHKHELPRQRQPRFVLTLDTDMAPMASEKAGTPKDCGTGTFQTDLFSSISKTQTYSNKTQDRDACVFIPELIFIFIKTFPLRLRINKKS